MRSYLQMALHTLLHLQLMISRGMRLISSARFRHGHYPLHNPYICWSYGESTPGGLRGFAASRDSPPPSITFIFFPEATTPPSRLLAPAVPDLFRCSPIALATCRFGDRSHYSGLSGLGTTRRLRAPHAANAGWKLNGSYRFNDVTRSANDVITLRRGACAPQASADH